MDRLAKALGVDFRYYLKESEDSKKSNQLIIKALPNNKLAKAHRHLQALEIGKYRMSIQASALHYCTPRKTLENLFEYTHWEVGMLDEANLPEIQQLLRDYVDGDWVYAYVPTALVEKVRQLLMEQSISCT